MERCTEYGIGDIVRSAVEAGGLHIQECMEENGKRCNGEYRKEKMVDNL